MPDTARTLATDMIADAGRQVALVHMAGIVWRAGTWREMCAGLSVMWAIITA